MKEELPAGWKRNKKGYLEYTMFPDEIKEMKQQEIKMFALIFLNIIQTLIILILL